MSRLYLSLLCTVLIVGCAPADKEQPSSIELLDPFEIVKDPEAKAILQKAMAAMGGLERWNNKQQISFTKDFTLYREDGSVENDVLQHHSYTYKPGPTFSITWTNKEARHEILQKEGTLSKTIDGVPDADANLQSLTNTVLSSVFVVDIPYKILDPGAVIRYAGRDTLEEGQVVDVIQVVYDPEMHSNHTTPDTWNLFFDAESSIMIAYMVQHADHFSYVRNLTDTVVEGFTVVTTRDSWRVNKNRELLYLRATYAYDEYEIEL